MLAVIHLRGLGASTIIYTSRETMSVQQKEGTDCSFTGSPRPGSFSLDLLGKSHL